jgi:hypothetical protein
MFTEANDVGFGEHHFQEVDKSVSTEMKLYNINNNLEHYRVVTHKSGKGNLNSDFRT